MKLLCFWRRLSLPPPDILVILLVQAQMCLSIAADPVKLPVLVLVPFPNPTNITEGWDRGLELLPAARLAARQINNRTDILDGYELQLIEADSDSCAVSQPRDSLNNFAQHMLNPKPLAPNAMAVVGLACSTVTASISLLSGRSEIDLIQVSMGNSPVFTNNAKYKRLWRVLPSSIAFVRTMLSLMERLDWRRVGVVYDGVGVYFRATAEAFIKQVLDSNNKTLIINSAIDNTDLFLDAAIESIRKNTVRVIYVSASIPESSRLLCKAVKNNLIWPGYQWIFNERTLNELLYNNDQCSQQEMARALENVISISSELGNPNKYLVSGQTYDEYQAAYVEILREMAATDPRYVNVDITYDNTYANAMYDELWALSLALNRSLPHLQEANISLANYQYNQSHVTEIIDDNFQFVAFNGAASIVIFDQYRETLTPSILRSVINGRMTQIGGYDTTNHQLSLNVSTDDFPEDDFMVVDNYLHLGMTVTLYILCVLGILVTTAKLLIYYYHRGTPDIKATSPLLMSLIFVGSYLMLLCSLLIVIQPVAAASVGLFSAICITWRTLFFVGFGMLVSTVLFRVIRIYRVFTHFGKTGKAWRDKYLFLYILLVSAIPLLQTILMIALDRNQYGVQIETDIYNNPPIKVRTLFCDATYLIIWQSFSGLYIVILLILLISFALLTRKIDRKHFKDTKKIIMFAFFMAFVILLGYPIVDILQSQLKDKSISTFLLCLLCLVITLVAQVFLVDTKVFPALCHYTIKGRPIETRPFTSQSGTFKRQTISGGTNQTDTERG